jgi:hypothetical protein
MNVKKYLPVVTGAVALLGAELANAASLLDTTTGTSVTSAFTDVSDTAKAIMLLVLVPIVGIVAIKAAPRILKALASMVK